MDAAGFTLLEMIVVTLIIAILAAIAIPVFFNQKQKGLVAQSQSALANAKIMAESYFVGDGDGSYTGLDVPGRIQSEGLVTADTVQVVVGSSSDEYCIVAVNISLPVEHDWKVAALHSSDGTPTIANDCDDA